MFKDTTIKTNSLLSLELITQLISNFYTNVFPTFIGKTILVPIRLDLGNNNNRSLSQFAKINQHDLQTYIKSVETFYNYKSSHYNNITFKDIYISYRLIKETSTFIPI